MKTILRYAFFFLPQVVFPGWIFCFSSQSIILPFFAMALHFLFVYLSGYLLIARFEAPIILLLQALFYCCSLAFQTIIALRLLSGNINQSASDTSDSPLDSPTLDLRSAATFLAASVVGLSVFLHKGWSFFLVKTVKVHEVLGNPADSGEVVRLCTKAVSDQFRIKGSRKFLGAMALFNTRGKIAIGRIVATDQEKLTNFTQNQNYGCIGSIETQFKVDLSVLETLNSLQLAPKRKIILMHEMLQPGQNVPSISSSVVHLNDVICLVSEPLQRDSKKMIEGCTQ